MTENDNTLWIFVHLSKSGGTTIKSHFYKHLDWDREFIEMSKWGISYRKKHLRLPLQQRNLSQRQMVRIIAGHRVYYGIHEYVPGKEPCYFTIVRDPAKRCVSRYNFLYSRQQTQQDFFSWYTKSYNRQRNFMVRFYAERYSNSKHLPYEEINLQLAKQFLDKCWFVGITENLSEDLHYIFSKMNLPTTWKNYRQAGKPESDLQDIETHRYNEREKIGKHQKVTTEIQQRIMEDHPLDYELFAYAKKLNIDKRNKART